MKLDEWLGTLPMQRTVRGKVTPGSSTRFNLFVRVQAGGNGFLMASQSGSEPYPVTDEQKAVEVFRALWRRAQSEAPREGADAS